MSAINRHFRALWEIVLVIRLPGSPLGIDHVTTIRPNLKCVVQTDPRSTMGFSDWTCNTQRLRLAQYDLLSFIYTLFLLGSFWWENVVTIVTLL